LPNSIPIRFETAPQKEGCTKSCNQAAFQVIVAGLNEVTCF